MIRSQEMTICDVYIQSDAAIDNLAILGELECVQFIDMNPGVSPGDRHFLTDLCRCADMERSLIMIRDEIVKEGIPIPRLRHLSEIKPLHPRDMFEFENMLDSVSKDVKDMSSNHTNLVKLISETKEIYYVINQLDPILGDVETGYTKFPKSMRLGGPGTYDRRQLKIITGVIDRYTSYHFRTMLWRISHGTVYYKEAPNDEKFVNPATGRNQRKVAFLIVCHGDEMQQRVLKVCNGFKVNLYRWPETHEDRLSTINELSKRMVEMDKVLQRTKVQRETTFHNIVLEWENWVTQVRKAKAIYYNLNLFNFDITSNTLLGQCWLADRNFNKVESALEQTSILEWENWVTQVRKAKAIYYNLNLFNFDITSNTLLGQCWLADRNFNKVESALEQTSGAASARSFIVRTRTEATPPTSYRTTKFTLAYQNVISTYDIGRYRELNPAVFSVILIPFLFGVMFGDVGHGILIFIYAAWMINNENKYLPRRSLNEVWNLIFAGRYIILLMGFFSMFMGFMYNACFSLSSKLMAAYWLNTKNRRALETLKVLTLSPLDETGFVYRYGIDPGIKLSLNGFMIENSLKMKLAIILGLTHMTFGLLLNICNMMYFRKFYAIICHTIPRLLFLWCIYGWLVYMFFYKWLVVYVSKATDYRSVWPTLTVEFLDLILWRNASIPAIRAILGQTKLIKKQVDRKAEMKKCLDRATVRATLYHIALACFPFMLIVSPIYLYTRYFLSVRRLENRGDYGECQICEYKKQQRVHFPSLLLHRLIRTMEFGLSAISHMASYLRLWALSMCHTLLTRFVWFWTVRSLALSDNTHNGIWKIILVFPIWALITAFILVLMDGMSIFVHVLRLQWIEFMSKFFKGGGIPFYPFSLVNILDDLDHKHHDDEAETLSRIRRARESAGDS